MSDIKDNSNNDKSEKKEYQKPEIVSEELTAFGAVCNGTSKGGRKQSGGPPGFCNASRLTS